MKSIKFDDTSIFIVLCLIMAPIFLPNGDYLFLCLFTFVAVFLWVQQPYKPGVFTVILAHHILQIAASVLLANYLGKGINERAMYTSAALMMSLLCVVFLFIPIIYQQRKIPTITLEQFREYATQFSIKKVLYCYLIALFVASSLGAVAFIFGNITQIIISLLKVKWFFFLLFGYLSFLKKEKRNIFVLCVLFEFLSGFFSFFSDFKTVIYFLIILFVSLVETVNLKNLISGLLMGIFLVIIGLFWTTIKTDYRNFLNGGEATQTVDRTQDEAYTKLYDLSSNIKEGTLSTSTVALLDRLQYLFHFAKAIETVPDKIPYQNGDNWFENFSYSTTPRFLNPDKKKVDNSVKASKYTGIRYLGSEKGVSFSLGYFAEAYIDFGFWGMPIFLFGLGFLYSKIYAYLYRNASDNPIFNYAVIGSFFMEFYAFEMDGTFLIGRLFSSCLTYIVLLRFFFPVVLEFITFKEEPENNF